MSETELGKGQNKKSSGLGDMVSNDNMKSLTPEPQQTPDESHNAPSSSPDIHDPIRRYANNTSPFSPPVLYDPTGQYANGMSICFS
jgi:hypothetical protein